MPLKEIATNLSTMTAEKFPNHASIEGWVAGQYWFYNFDAILAERMTNRMSLTGLLFNKIVTLLPFGLVETYFSLMNLLLIDENELNNRMGQALFSTVLYNHLLWTLDIKKWLNKSRKPLFNSRGFNDTMDAYYQEQLRYYNQIKVPLLSISETMTDQILNTTQNWMTYYQPPKYDARLDPFYYMYLADINWMNYTINMLLMSPLTASFPAVFMPYFKIYEQSYLKIMEYFFLGKTESLNILDIDLMSSLFKANSLIFTKFESLLQDNSDISISKDFSAVKHYLSKEWGTRANQIQNLL